MRITEKSSSTHHTLRQGLEQAAVTEGSRQAGKAGADASVDWADVAWRTRGRYRHTISWVARQCCHFSRVTVSVIFSKNK